MSIFDESSVEASHNRLASSVSAEIEILTAAADLILKALLHQDVPRDNSDQHADYLAVSQLGLRIVNGIGAATRLIDCGYFVQAAGILRDIAEIGMLALLLSEKPEKLIYWRKSAETRHKQFGRQALGKEIAARDKFQLLDMFFDTFSKFGTHPSAESIIAHHDGTSFHLGAHINERLYIDLHRDSAFLTWHTTDAFRDAYHAIFGFAVAKVLPNEAGRFVASWYEMRTSPPVGEEAISAS